MQLLSTPGEDERPSPAASGFDCETVIHLARAIALKFPSDWPGLRLSVVTEGSQAVSDEPVAQPIHALASGACRSIALEVPHLRCGCIDIARSADRSSADQLAQEILDQHAHPLVVLRGARRFVPSLEPLDLPPDGGPGSVLRPRGTYLVTGGLGGVGAALAQHLAQTVGARLVLVSRRAGEELTAIQQQRVAAMQAAGGAVLLVGGDVASEPDMKRALAAAANRFGPVHGIVHAAGIPAGAMIVTPQAASLEAVLRPKVEGTLVLSRVFRDTPLDFVTLCSSLVSVTGSPAQAGYCAANAFLDVVPYTDLFPGAAVQAINWATWRDVGMAVEIDLPPELEQRRQENLRTGISTADGARIFALALASGCPRVVVSTHDVQSRVAGMAMPESSPMTAAAPPVPAPAEPAKPQRPGDPLRDIEDALCGIWSEALRLPSVRPDDNVFELGADSLVALQVMATIEQRFARELSPIVCYEAPTARLLARLLTSAEDDGDALAQSEARGLRRQRGSSW